MEKVIIKFEKEVSRCGDCPLHHFEKEMGFSYDECEILAKKYHDLNRSAIPSDVVYKGIFKNCPYRK